MANSSAQSPGARSVLLGLTINCLRSVRAISPTELLRNHNKRYRNEVDVYQIESYPLDLRDVFRSALAFTELYVLILWPAALVLLLLLTRVGEAKTVLGFVPWGWLTPIFAVLALMRLGEITVFQASIVMFRSKTARLFDCRREVLLGFSNIIQVALIFAILAAAIQGANAKSFTVLDFNQEGKASLSPLTERFDFVYLSLTNLTTLGNGYQLGSWCAKLLTMAEPLWGLFIITITIAALVGALLPGSLHGSSREQDQVGPL